MPISQSKYMFSPLLYAVCYLQFWTILKIMNWLFFYIKTNLLFTIFNNNKKIKISYHANIVFRYTGGTRYMRSFYLRFMQLKNSLFFWNLSSNLQRLFVFLYANSLYASIFLESQSLEYNEVHLYIDFLMSIDS